MKPNRVMDLAAPLLWAAVWTAADLPSVAEAAHPKPPQDEASAFFEPPKVVKIRIEMSPQDVETFKQGHRPYAKCTIEEDGKAKYTDVGIKMKGAAGSTRGWEDRPALTLNMNKFKKKQAFHGLDKFHLNNSVQDDGLLHEYICSAVFRAGGYPAPRVNWARVWLNGRDVGMYVLKEGFDKSFLRRWFPDPKGNLYDGGFLRDVDQDLEKDEGDGPTDHSDLHAVRDAAREGDPKVRWEKLEKLVDMDQFFAFMALERMICHWDGYINNTNNYRIYFDPQTKKAMFLPHGMDQCLGDPNYGIWDQGRPLVASGVMQNDAWRNRYREQVKRLVSVFDPPDALQQRVDEAEKALIPAIEEWNKDAANHHRGRAEDLKRRLRERGQRLKQIAAEPDRQTEGFQPDGSTTLGGWWGHSEVENGKHQEVDSPEPDKRPSYHITGGKDNRLVASWRRHVLLPRGTYTLSVDCRIADFQKLGNEASGPFIRHSHQGRTPLDDGGLSAAAGGWKRLETTFEIKEDRRELELLAEFVASKGQVWFARDSFRLVKK